VDVDGGCDVCETCERELESAASATASAPRDGDGGGGRESEEEAGRRTAEGAFAPCGLLWESSHRGGLVYW
jgi:hypothetical protein